MLPTTGLTRGVPNPRFFKFADRLRRARRDAGLHAAGLCRAAGLSKSAVLRLEIGPGLPTLPTVEKLARALGLAPGWLAFGLGDIAAAPAGDELLCRGLAERERAVRAERGLSALGLAKVAGLTDGAIRSVESGRQPSLATLEAIATALQVSPAWLAYREGPRELPRRGRVMQPEHALAP